MSRLRDSHNIDDVIESLKERTVYVKKCWIYTGEPTKSHPRICFQGKRVQVNKLIAYIVLGIPLWQQVNHKRICLSRRCWNPLHLYAGTAKENYEDWYEVGKQQDWRELIK